MALENKNRLPTQNQNYENWKNREKESFNNPYYQYLKKFFDNLVILLHNQSLIRRSLNSSVNSFSAIADNNDFIFFQALIIGDWTGPADKGWKINYHTGSDRLLDFEKYKMDVERLVNNECCYSSAQAVERLQEFFKDCISLKMSMNAHYCKRLKHEVGKDFSFYRDKAYKREMLFDCVKKASKLFNDSSKNNNHNIRYKEFCAVLFVIRDAIVHSNLIIKKKSVKNWTSYHYSALKFLLPNTTDENYAVIMDIKDSERIITKIAEFGFQVFKLISLEENHDYKVLINMT